MQNEPITRQEILLNAVATGDVANLEPITREEMFLAKLGGADVTTPTPITRKEQFLQKAIESGTSGGGGTPGGGGSSASVPWNDVTFIDYDGTVLHSYTLEEAQALTELPPLPEQKGLICQGWNWSLEDIKAQGKVTVGAMYITDDGKTRIYITLREGRTSPMLGVCPKGTVTVDWGDGTEPDVLTGTSTSSVKWTPTHNYASAGDYVISLSVDGTMGVNGVYSSWPYGGSNLLRYTTSSDQKNYVYQQAITKVEFGDGVTSIGSIAFCSCRNLMSVTIPNGVTSIAERAFQGGYALKSVTIPKSSTSIGAQVLVGCYNLASVAVPNGITSIGDQAFNDCSSLLSVVIPNGVTKLGLQTYSGCHFLTSLKLPNSLTRIGENVFSYCYGVHSFDFSACTSVPTLQSTTAFSILDDCQFLIPSALFDEWSTATNWTAYASYMVAV